MLSAYDKLDTKPGLQNIANNKRDVVSPLMKFTVFVDRQTSNTYYSNEHLMKKTEQYYKGKCRILRIYKIEGLNLKMSEDV